jgi:3-phosphoshikimate 1-carboxyvinyltransferase
MNVNILLEDNIMRVQGNANIKGAVVHSNHDHRIAMACAIAALKANGETTILAAEAINKSYPDFYDHLKRLNASVRIA